MKKINEVIKMMQKTLDPQLPIFKAKKIDTNEWVIGFVARLTRDANGKRCFEFNELDECGWTGQCLVLAETLCRPTWLKDKNGELIWENDIVHIPYRNLEDSVCKVIFRNGRFIGELPDTTEDNIVRFDIEVIGNIFDNPGLMNL